MKTISSGRLYAWLILLIVIIASSFLAIGIGTGEGQYVAFLILFPSCLIFYFYPAIVAYSRKHRNMGSIVLLDLFAGWTFIGWIVALIWSFAAFNTTTAEPETQHQVPESAAMRKCPYCAEDVRAEAIKCKHCGSDIPAAAIEQGGGAA